MEININKTRIPDDDIIKAVKAAIMEGESAQADNDAMSECGWSFALSVDVCGEPVSVIWYPMDPDEECDEYQCDWDMIDLARY